MLLELQLEATALNINEEAAAGEGIFEGGCEGPVVANLNDGLKSCGEVAAVVMKDGSEGADLG